MINFDLYFPHDLAYYKDVYFFLIFNQFKFFFLLSSVSLSYFTTGSQHSGAYDEDFNASSNDLDSNQQESTHENINESIEDEDDDDTEGVDARCIVCERQCGDIDQ